MNKFKPEKSLFLIVEEWGGKEIDQERSLFFPIT